MKIALSNIYTRINDVVFEQNKPKYLLLKIVKVLPEIVDELLENGEDGT